MEQVVRFVRIAEKAKGIKNLMLTFFETLPYLLNVFVVLCLFIFIYAVVGVTLFTNVKKQAVLGANLNFDTFFDSVTTLLLIAWGENWTDLMRDCMVSPPLCTHGAPAEYWAALPQPVITERGATMSNCGHPFLSPLYFITFMILITYISLNIMVAVILSTFFDLEGVSFRPSFPFKCLKRGSTLYPSYSEPFVFSATCGRIRTKSHSALVRLAIQMPLLLLTVSLTWSRAPQWTSHISCA
jgi:hypothetical protein|eukprot:COSAG01_NODE_2817_length_7018_cov_4.014017_3_plen_241_part_00